MNQKPIARVIETRPAPRINRIDVIFNHWLERDEGLAHERWEDFLYDTPHLLFDTPRGDLRELVLFQSPQAMDALHYSADDLDALRQTPLALAQEWLQYDAYELGFDAYPDGIDPAWTPSTFHHYDTDDNHAFVEACADVLDDMRADLARVTAREYVVMLATTRSNRPGCWHLSDELLPGFNVTGYSQGDAFYVLFYDQQTQDGYKYLTSECIENLAFNQPLNGNFTVTLPDYEEEVYLCDVFPDGYDEYSYWDDDLRTAVIDGIINQLRETLPYTEEDNNTILDMAREYMQANFPKAGMI